MTRRAGILAASFVLEHVPDLVRYGSKPAREAAEVRRPCATSCARFEQARGYAPNQVFIGNLRPEELWERRAALVGRRRRRVGLSGRPYGDIIDQRAFYELWTRSTSSTSCASARSRVPRTATSRSTTATRSWAPSRAPTTTTRR